MGLAVLWYSIMSGDSIRKGLPLGSTSSYGFAEAHCRASESCKDLVLGRMESAAWGHTRTPCNLQSRLSRLGRSNQPKQGTHVKPRKV